MKSGIIRYNMDGLNSFIKALDESGKYKIKVGVLGSKVNRKQGDTTQTNAEIGFKHEFGSYQENVPQRSFLRMPLNDKVAEILEMVKLGGLLLHLVAGDIKQVFKLIGVACENIIGNAFETSGFGNWKSLTAYTIARKIQHNPDPLINTRQLQRSITSKVELKGDT